MNNEQTSAAAVKVLLIGGSGFLSGTMARAALRQGHDVWAVTRGQRPVVEGVRKITADRKDRRGFAEAVARENVRWDLVVDCIGYSAEDAAQDVEVFSGRASRLVFISTDFVISPIERPWKIDETYDRFNDTPYGTGKRAAEEVLLNQRSLSSTVLRPGHIYGPGSLLGCIPLHGRDPQLLDRLRKREALSLVGGGHFLQAPVFAADLWEMALSCFNNPAASGQVYFAPGPDVVESRAFYRIIGEILGVDVTIGEVPISEYLREHPEHQSFCTHRVYCTDKATHDGLKRPTTPLREGLRLHVNSMI